MAGLIDVGILRPELAGAFGAGYRSSQQARQQATEAEQQLAMNRQKLLMDEMTMERLKEDRAAMLQLQDRLKAAGQDPDLNKVFDALIATGNPDYVTKGIDGKRRLKEQDQFALIMGGGVATPPVAAPNAMAKEVGAAPEQPANQLGSGMFGMTVGPSAPAVPVNQLRPELVPAGVDRNALINRRNSLIALGTPQAIAAANVIDRDIREKTPVESKPSEIKQYELAVSQGYKGSFLDFKKDIAAASRPLPQPRAESPPVAVVDEATGKIKYVTREQAMGMTPAAATENLPPKEIQKREAAFPQATAAVKGHETKSDLFISDLKKLRDDPGLNNITGAVFGRTGSVSEAGSRAQALYDKVVAKGGFQALQDLRDASKTGGALGNVSNQEGKQLTASFAAIDRRQSAADVRAAIDQAIADIEGSKVRMREAYDSTYAYKQGRSPAPAAAGAGVDTSNPLLK